ncbi:MAG: YicC family protein [Candidatus Cloacimonetes bacterium]|nr:YicC family protein [Candidatus Cloacimonadota bacterium]
MKSMTGYGNSKFQDEFYEVDVEIKSLNHRFLDMSVYTNNEINHLEFMIRKQVSEKIKRGKVYVTVTATDKSIPDLELDKELLEQLIRIHKDSYEAMTIDKEPDIDEILKYEGVIRRRKMRYNDEKMTSIIENTLQKALESYLKMTYLEGAIVKEWLKSSMERIAKELVTIEAHLPQYRTDLHERLKKVIEEVLKFPLDSDIEKRLMVEVSFYIDKYDINEEIVRLRDHLEKMTEILKIDGQETGKKMNFIIQEMQREIQTLSAKFNNVQVFPSILAIKEQIEKCREMIQNVE